MWSSLDFFPEPFLIQVLDIGASYIGPTRYEKLIDAKRCRVMGFEPQPDACEDLRQRFGPPHLFFPYFIGDGRPATFYQTSFPPCCSIFKPNHRLLDKLQNLGEALQVVATQEVNTARLDDFEAITNVDWISIDVQGAELKVFENAERILRDVMVIETEFNYVPLYEGQALFSDIDQFLRNRGFQLHTVSENYKRCFKPILTNNDPELGINQVLWCNAVYVRDWVNLDALSLEKLRAYAIILHEGYGSFDLTNLCLEAIDRKQLSDLSVRYLNRLTVPKV
jgi:protein O-GlcNAc transferase